MLAFNRDNRPLSEKTIRRYTASMMEGEWKMTYEPIVFSSLGRLIDGQHRLHACLRSGRAFPCRVAFGDDDTNFDRINTGKTRNAGDVFAMNDVPNWAMAAGITRLVASYDDFKLHRGAHGGGASYENHALYGRYVEYGRIQDSCKIGQLANNNRKTFKRLAVSVIGAAHFISARKARGQADEFFHKVFTGIGIERQNEPENRLRIEMIESGHSDHPMSSTTIMAVIILAWNANRAGKTPRQFRWGADERFPRAV